jgi:hypothetical protein
VSARSSLSPLAALYTQLNEHFWEGQLPPPTPPGVYGGDTRRGVVVRRVGIRRRLAALYGTRGLRVRGIPADAFCYGRFSAPSRFYPARIQVVSPLSQDDERQALLHEMVHCRLFFAGFTTEPHGARFVAELERLAAMGEAWALEQAADYRARGPE